MTEAPPAERPDASPTLGERLRGLLRTLLLLAALGFTIHSLMQAGAPLEAGTSPASRLRSYDDVTWDLSRFAGKKVVLNFWATWCPPCMQELPHFARLAREFAEEVVFIGPVVSSPRDEVFRVIEKFDVRYPVAEASSEMVQAWRATSLPSTYLLDEDHRVVWSVTGMLSAQQLEDALRTHLGVGVDTDLTPRAPTPSADTP